MDEDMLHTVSQQDHPQRPNSGTSRSSPAGGPSPNPRSCITCRRRKVKCDKKNPCSNCVRAKIDCIFPGPGRAPRKSRKPPDAELLDRLRRLEAVVLSLNAQVEEHEQEQEATDREKERQSSAGAEPCPGGSGGHGGKKLARSVAVDHSVEGLENRFGRLVVEKGRSRYINSSFWASLNNEVEDLKSILIEPSDEEADVCSPGSSNNASEHQSFIFGYNSTAVDMRSLHPSEQQARQFWEAYKENVDPLVKVLHIPTFEPKFFNAVSCLEKVPKAHETILFAIYYGAVTSSTTEDCLERWGEDRSTLLKRYRFGLEQALARANFLYCDHVIILQAFIVFLILLRRNDDARKIWTLTGLVVRIAQTLGIHRDGTHFGLPPYQIEIRRRIWWQVCILDARSSEDHGCDPTILEAQFDTKMPLNINDADMHVDMTDFPIERQGFTDMTFCLLRFEVNNILRCIMYIPPGPNRCTEYFAGLSIADKEKCITECHRSIEDKYLKDCDMSIPLCWVTATISRLIMSKMWLIVYHPHQRKDGGATLPQETKDKLFITSLENVEYSILLETEARTMKWGWLFRTYVQWHAIAFLLSELCVRTKGEAVERAWQALEATAGRWWYPLNDGSIYGKGKQGCLWKPLRKLLAKAKAAREKELALERASLTLRSDQFPYSHAPELDQVGVSSVTADQPSPENLDRLLRPFVPKLGETPIAERPSWPDSPPGTDTRSSNPQSSNTQSPFSIQNGIGLSKQQALPGSNSSSTRGSSSPHNDFPGALHFGLDDVLLDSMEDMRPDGTYISDYPMSGPAGLVNNVPSLSQPPQSFATNPLAYMPTAYAPGTSNGVAQPTFGNAMFSNLNMNFATTSPILDSDGQIIESPILDGGMDWTLWDDMVNQYGIEGQTGIPSSTDGPGHLGLVNWF